MEYIIRDDAVHPLDAFSKNPTGATKTSVSHFALKVGFFSVETHAMRLYFNNTNFFASEKSPIFI